MARTGRPKTALVLSDEERATLLRWSKRAKSAQALALRCRIVLACAKGLSNKEVAADLRCAPVTVGKWRAGFVAARPGGLGGGGRPVRAAASPPHQGAGGGGGPRAAAPQGRPRRA